MTFEIKSVLGVFSRIRNDSCQSWNHSSFFLKNSVFKDKYYSGIGPQHVGDRPFEFTAGLWPWRIKNGERYVVLMRICHPWIVVCVRISHHKQMTAPITSHGQFSSPSLFQEVSLSDRAYERWIFASQGILKKTSDDVQQITVAVRNRDYRLILCFNRKHLSLFSGRRWCPGSSWKAQEEKRLVYWFGEST